MEAIVSNTPQAELKELIDDICNRFSQLGKMKSNPLVAMYRDGELTYKFVIEEIERIRLHESKLSKGKREAVECLVGEAIERYQKKKEDDKSV